MVFTQLGGEAIASGGYGCVFAPAIPCEGSVVKLTDNQRPAGVSKLIESSDLAEEVKVAMEVYKKVKEIPNHNDYFLFPTDYCSPAAVPRKELMGFDGKCAKFASNRWVAPSRDADGLYRFPSTARILNAPHGGDELHALVKRKGDSAPFLAFTLAAVADLLTNAIGPMNDRNVTHNDIKGENMMLGEDGHVRIIDWGLGGVANGTGVPSFVKHREFQFNTPFSSILFDRDLPRMSCEAPTVETVSAFVSATNGIPLCEDLQSSGGPSHYKYVLGAFVPALFQCGPGPRAALVARQTFAYMFIDYLTKIIKKYNIKGRFNPGAYYRETYIHNADVWGAITVFISFLRASGGTVTESDKSRIRKLVITYMFGSEYAASPIPIPQLAKEMTEIATSIVKRVGKQRLSLSLPPNLVKRLGVLLAKKRAPKTKDAATRKAKEPAKTQKVTKAQAKAQAQGRAEPECPAGRFHFLGKCRTSSGRSDSQTRKSPAAHRKRCPNGTRRNKSTGDCEPK